MTERYAYVLELTDLDQLEFDKFVSQEVVRLDAMVAQIESETVRVMIETWSCGNGGVDPDTSTLAGLHARARIIAEETVLATHVWEGYRRPADGEWS